MEESVVVGSVGLYEGVEGWLWRQLFGDGAVRRVMLDGLRLNRPSGATEEEAVGRWAGRVGSSYMWPFLLHDLTRDGDEGVRAFAACLCKRVAWRLAIHDDGVGGKGELEVWVRLLNELPSSLLKKDGGSEDALSKFLPPGMGVREIMAGAVRAASKSLVLGCVQYGGKGWELRDGRGRTAMHVAVAEENGELLKWLKRSGGEEVWERVVREGDKGTVVVLEEAWRMKRKRVFELMMHGGKEFVSDPCRGLEAHYFTAGIMKYKHSYGRTALHKAARDGNVGVVCALLGRGADIKIKDYGGMTALHEAADNGHFDVVEMLLDRGADMETKDNIKWTPLHMAASNGHSDVVGVLLNRGADMEAKDNEWRTPLHRAALHGRSDVVVLLLNRGADMEAKDNDRWTPLHMAAFHGHVDVVGVLLDRGADMEAKNIVEKTPLHRAAWSGHSGVVRMLLDRGADMEAKDNRGRTPHSLANGSTADLLRSRGAHS